MARVLYLDGGDFSTVKGCWHTLERGLAGPDWEVRERFDVLDDLLEGGYALHDVGEPLHIKWIGAQKSRRNFGAAAFDEFAAAIEANEHVTLELR